MPAMPSPMEPTGRLDTEFLRGLLGYNTRRATLRILELFEASMRAFNLDPVEFSVLCLVAHNPDVTPGQICTELGLAAPNLAKILARFARRRLVDRVRPESDRRSVMLRLTDEGRSLIHAAKREATRLERDAARHLTDRQLESVNRLLQRVYDAPDSSSPQR